MPSVPRFWTILFLLSSLGGPRLRAQDNKLTELSPAKAGALYAYALETNKPAEFRKVKGSAEWLSVTRDGILTGTPDEHSLARTEITVEASWQGKSIRRSFV